MPTIVITGGHHNSALVVAQDFVAKGVKVLWYGQTRASRGDQNESAEYLEVKAAKIPFHTLEAGKIDSTPTFAEIINIPLGFIRALRLLINHRPDAVLSFGGYLGLTTAIPAYLLRIPVYLHEQTLHLGKANLLTARFAKRVFLTWPNTRPHITRGEVVGLPLRPALLESRPVQPFPNSLPTILVMGGKRGSHLINQVIIKHLPELLKAYNLIHQTGTNSVTKDLDAALSSQSTLPPDLAARYRPIGYIDEFTLSSILRSVDLYVGRSGAHISYELLYFSLRAILIPFMHTTGSEQYRQAELLHNLLSAIVLPQSELSGPTLLANIKRVLQLSLPPQTTVPLNASAKIVQQILADL